MSPMTKLGSGLCRVGEWRERMLISLRLLERNARLCLVAPFLKSSSRCRTLLARRNPACTACQSRVIQDREPASPYQMEGRGLLADRDDLHLDALSVGGLAGDARVHEGCVRADCIGAPSQLSCGQASCATREWWTTNQLLRLRASHTS